MLYSNWSGWVGLNENGDKDCVRSNGFQGLKVEPCTKKLPFVCEGYPTNKGKSI